MFKKDASTGMNHIRKGPYFFRRLSFGDLVWGGVSLLLGLLNAVFWQRRRLCQTDD